MTIYSGGRSTAINSPRHLVLRHVRRAVRLQKLSMGVALAAHEDVPEPDLAPGQEKLNSYWAPSLEAGGVHRVKATQIIDAKNGKDAPLELVAEQDFTVDAPQFTLPPDSVHSVYPPPGYSDDNRILPHVVLTDPHLPWERLGSPKSGVRDADRNRVPWLALFSFSEDELRLAPGVLDGGAASIFRGTSAQLAKPVKQTPTLAVNISIADLLATTDTATPVAPDSDKDARADFIFVPPDLFTSFFSPFDANGQRQVPGAPDVTQYKFLSHVRKINTTGMAVAGVEDIGIFSVVVGNRSGPLDNPRATPVCVHLVSIEGVENMKFPITQSHVALCSLHSWTYMVQPPGMLNVPDAFEALGQTVNVLRPPDSVIDSLKTAGKLPARVASRLEDGYSLVQYRTQTGEPTVALFRGPFTPTVVPKLPLNQCSNTGQDLQIMDKEVGIMDITYSSAWQLGRTLALGDQAFTAALTRLRTTIHTSAMKQTKMEVMLDATEGGFRTRVDVLRDLPETVKNLSLIHATQHPESNHNADEGGDGDHSVIAPPAFRPGGHFKRWHRTRPDKSNFPNLSFSAPRVEERYLDAANAAATHLAGSTDGTHFDETNMPKSSDWMVVLAWLMDRMFLDGVPAHYLITDPSHLGPESLRFFHIDANWVDALLDGSLSLANHSGHDTDRVAIKHALNAYIRRPPSLLAHAPQVPTYGFLLRSDLVSAFPDLRVTTLPPQPDPPVRAPLLRHNIVADGVMLALLDRVPGAADFSGLVFTQPPHQQRFAVARGLAADGITVNIRRQYTVDASIRATDPLRYEALKLDNLPRKPGDADNVFIWRSAPAAARPDLHMLRLPRFAELQRQALADHMGSYDDGTTKTKYFDDDTATSALFALQLNDPIYSLTISLTTPGTAMALASLAPPPPPPGEDAGTPAHEPRTLQRLLPSRVTRLYHPADLLHDDAEDDDDAAAALPAAAHSDPAAAHAEDDAEAAERHTSYQPAAHALDAGLAPHVRAPILAAAPAAPATPGRPTAAATSATSAATAATASIPRPRSDPAQPPSFACRVCSVGAYSVVTPGDALPQDLVFAVLVGNNPPGSQYRLQELALRVELGAADVGRARLLANYAGPGASMLSNLRFNVLPVFDSGGSDGSGVGALLLRLLPRSRRRWVGIAGVRELSFLLSLAQVNEYPQRRTQLRVKTTARYQDVEHAITDSFMVTIINTTFPPG